MYHVTDGKLVKLYQVSLVWYFEFVDLFIGKLFDILNVDH